MKYLFWAYTLTWALIFAYTLVLGSREKKLLREVNFLKQAVNDNDFNNFQEY
ncbi:MAG: CcmD family protein [Desulfitobacteriaceae bacterium]|nr:CcmD family protein [Desulfitobacteriaceae bacterium]